MRFVSKYRPLTYVVSPQQTKYDAAGKPIGATKPIRIRFDGAREGVFDSSQVRDSKERKKLEDFLLEHPDKGTFFHVVEEAAEQTVGPKAKTCIATVQITGEPARQCGQPVLDGLDYCADCAEVETTKERAVV